MCYQLDIEPLYCILMVPGPGLSSRQIVHFSHSVTLGTKQRNVTVIVPVNSMTNLNSRGVCHSLEQNIWNHPQNGEQNDPKNDEH
jgi:hypothetical protein